jgi:dihydroorotate dehydrogenase (fumarate)
LSDSGKSFISMGLAGLSGKALKHIGLGQIKQWNDALQSMQATTGLIAVGGISTGKDIEAYRILGATAFQMTTELLKGGDIDLRPFEKVVSEYFEVPA